MKRLRIRFPKTELDLLTAAVDRFNETHGYLDKIAISVFNDHQVLLIAPAESTMFAESYLGELPVFSKRRLRQDLIRELESLIEHEPNNLPALHSLKVLKDLSF